MTTDNMTSDNPYDAPRDSSAAPPAGAATLMWSMGTVFGSAIVGGLLGLGIGVAIAKFAPGYYRTVFGAGGDPTFDPVSVGIGLGLTQGTGLGTLVGLVLVALFYWYRTRAARLRSD